MSVVALACWSAAWAPAADTLREQLKKLQGAWRVVAVAWQGEPVDFPTEGDGAADVLIEKDKLSYHCRGNAEVFKITRIKAGEIDLTKPATRPGPARHFVGIYELRGDSLLKICRAEYDPEDRANPPKRPTEYRSPKDSPNFVYFLERKKDEK